MRSPYTILDDIVIETLKVVDRINDDRRFNRKVVVAGGMALQLYNDKQLEDLLRPSMDIDCATYPSLSNTQYYGLHSYISSELNSKGFKCSEFPKKHQRNIGTICQDNNYHDTSLVIHFDRFSTGYFEKIGFLEKRKVDDAMSEPLYYKGIRVHTVKPEQILNGKMKTLVHKIRDTQRVDLRRLFNYAKNLNFVELSKVKLSSWLPELIETKSTIVSAQNHGRLVDAEVVAEYKLSKNLYDTCLLARNIETGHITFDEKAYLDIRVQTDAVLGKFEDPFTDFYFTP